MSKPLKIHWAGTGHPTPKPPRGTLPFNWLHVSLLNVPNPGGTVESIPLENYRDVARRCRDGEVGANHRFHPGALSDLDHEPTGYAPQHLPLLIERAKAFKDEAPNVPLTMYWFIGSPNAGLWTNDGVIAWDARTRETFARMWDTGQPLFDLLDAICPSCYAYGEATDDYSIDVYRSLCLRLKERFGDKPVYPYLSHQREEDRGTLTPEVAARYLFEVGGAGDGAVLWGEALGLEGAFRKAIDMAETNAANLPGLSDDEFTALQEAVAVEGNRRQKEAGDRKVRLDEAERKAIELAGQDSVSGT